MWPMSKFKISHNSWIVPEIIAFVYFTIFGNLAENPEISDLNLQLLSHTSTKQREKITNLFFFFAAPFFFSSCLCTHTHTPILFYFLSVSYIVYISILFLYILTPVLGLLFFYVFIMFFPLLEVNFIFWKFLIGKKLLGSDFHFFFSKNHFQKNCCCFSFVEKKKKKKKKKRDASISLHVEKCLNCIYETKLRKQKKKKSKKGNVIKIKNLISKMFRALSTAEQNRWLGILKFWNTSFKPPYDFAENCQNFIKKKFLLTVLSPFKEIFSLIKRFFPKTLFFQDQKLFLQKNKIWGFGNRQKL